MVMGENDGSNLPVDKLEKWLSERLGLGGRVEVTDVTPLSTGFSAETLSLWAAYDDGSGQARRRLILRRESPDPPIYPTQSPGHLVEVDIQFRIMDALTKGTGIPLAPLVGYEESPDVVGAPFYMMEFVEGVVPLVAPSYARDGFFAEATPDLRRAMITEGLGVMAELQTVDWRADGLRWLFPDGEEPTALRQLRIWKDYSERELAGREHPLLAAGFAWLESNLPAHDPDSVTLLWGDGRPGNMIWQDHHCVCVTDFEAAAIGPYGIDLGWWLMFDRWSHEHSAAARLEGEPTREEQAATFFEASGRTPEPTHWYEVFAAARYCAIVVRVMNRTVERKLAPADNTYWLDNQATDCLKELLP